MVMRTFHICNSLATLLVVRKAVELENVRTQKKKG
jgi:hypothetical protein